MITHSAAACVSPAFGSLKALAESVGVTLTPVAPGLDVGEQQTFTVSVSGSLPVGVQYIWTLTGTAGSIGTLNLVTTTVPTLLYTAVRKGTDTLKVQVADASNHLLASGSAVITVDPDAFIEFVIAGTWDQTTMTPNGSYSYADYIGGRGTYGDSNHLIDALIFQYDNFPGVAGVLFSMDVAPGAPYSQGQAFAKVPIGSFPVPGQFNILLSTNLGNPNAVNAQQYNPVGTGTCTIDTLDQLVDGTYLAEYSFSISNGAGGTIIGSGVGTWK